MRRSSDVEGAGGLLHAKTSATPEMYMISSKEERRISTDSGGAPLLVPDDAGDDFCSPPASPRTSPRPSDAAWFATATGARQSAVATQDLPLESIPAASHEVVIKITRGLDTAVGDKGTDARGPGTAVTATPMVGLELSHGTKAPSPAPPAAAAPPRTRTAAPAVRASAAFALPTATHARTRAFDPLRASCPVTLHALGGGSSGVESGSQPDWSLVPRHMRPTAAHAARVAHAAAAAAAAPPPHAAPVVTGGPKASCARKAPSKAGMVSRVWAPTKAFLARVTGRDKRRNTAAPQTRAATPALGSTTPDAPLLRGSQAFGSSVASRMTAGSLRQSMALESILTARAGERVTRTEPFTSHASTRARPPSELSYEDAALRESREHAFRPHVVPAHVHQARPIDTHVRSTPKNPSDVFVPFALASESRHRDALARIAEEAAVAEVEDASRRQFHATDVSKVKKLLATPDHVPKPTAAPATVAAAPCFETEARAEHRTKVVEPALRASSEARAAAAAAKAQAAAERRALAARLAEEREAREAAEADAMERVAVLDLRKSLVFRAREMPDPDSPVFCPDLSRARFATRPAEFDLATDRRLGKPAPKSTHDGLGTGGGGAVRYGGAGAWGSSFAASLRSSAVFERPMPLISPRTTPRGGGAASCVSGSESGAGGRRRPLVNRWLLVQNAEAASSKSLASTARAGATDGKSPRGSRRGASITTTPR